MSFDQVFMEEIEKVYVHICCSIFAVYCTLVLWSQLVVLVVLLVRFFLVFLSSAL